ncbi:MAG TPA: hypothetical protein VMW56_00810 [Candidatus Margulisiibacteriota bacterium]|nr:hypothetical protein [Candidatus Margulisiibacteriota bacterium]
MVTVNNLVVMINIALEETLVSACEAGDRNQDGVITVDKIVTAVNNALNGCGWNPTTTGSANRSSAGRALAARSRLSDC